MRLTPSVSLACCAALVLLACTHDSLAYAIALVLLAVLHALRRAKVV